MVILWVTDILVMLFGCPKRSEKEQIKSKTKDSLAMAI